MSAYSQTERWDEKNYIYSNFEYGFSWSMPSDVEWKKISGTEKHTVFKIRQPDTQITAFVNANPIENMNADVWDSYERMIQQHKEADISIEQMSGIKTLNHAFKKCLFCGQHAIKSYSHTSMFDDRCNEPIEVIGITYWYAKNGYIYAVSVKTHKQVYDFVGDFMAELFKGYSIINRK